MPWYSVIKTINGRQYLYLQMTYRDGGKVKTRNKYIGPARASGFGSGAPANLPTAPRKYAPPTITPTPTPTPRAPKAAVHKLVDPFTRKEMNRRTRIEQKRERDFVRADGKLARREAKAGPFRSAIIAYQRYQLRKEYETESAKFSEYCRIYYARQRENDD